MRKTISLLLIIFIISCESPSPSDGPEGPESIKIEKVQEFDETPSGHAEAQRLAQSNPASDFSATGLYLPVNTDLTIDVQVLEEGSGIPRLLIGTYSRYEDAWNPIEREIEEGTQTIQGTEHGGLVYVRYHANDAVEPSGRIQITFEEGYEPAPHFVLGETTNNQWQTMLDAWTESPDVILESERGMIVASRAHAQEYQDEDQQQLLTILDDIFGTEAAISGLDGSSDLHQLNTHKILLTETDKSDTYMAATWYRTWYHQDVVKNILTVEGLGTDGWGPWHELGHMHQQGAWTWDELGEVTVNIYSLAAERAMGISESRLTREDVWYDVQDYLALPDNERDFNSNSAGLFVRLGMFQQLWLAYGDEFYHQLHKQTRQESPSLDDREDKMRYFMLKACEISGRDLGGVFSKVGLSGQPVCL